MVATLRRGARGRRGRRRRSGLADRPQPFLTAPIQPPHCPRVGADGLQLGATRAPMPVGSKDFLRLFASESMRAGEHAAPAGRAFEDPERIPVRARASAAYVGVAVPPSMPGIKGD